ncbi:MULTISPECIES: Rab family GTPase [Cyanophyceae]|jgi:small GTP-binding protein|uniref:Rab family GTPase n=1 Tax=Cyanophyceae TaxID=3028117 RepID=UPI0016881C98|nr:Rab family GTPase [Trichocoleus sp. FACHB-40]MBD2003489.1 GTP-binding protein [Trichocoleus sp. FACHB-40]
MSSISKKICLVGDFGVGKTSLIRRFVDRQFSDKYLSTVGVKISRKTVELEQVKQHEKLSVNLLIWDLEGSTKFKAIAPTYLQGASAAILVGDVSRQETIEHLADHLNLFLSVNPKGFIIIALNKSDLADEEKLAKLLQMSNNYQQAQVLSIQPTSAKTGQAVDEIFKNIAYKIIE